MIKRLVKEHAGTFLRYSIVGVSGTLLDIGLFALLISSTPLGDTTAGHVVAASFSFLAAVVNNYTWNRLWTFKDFEADTKTQFIKFFTVSCGGWILNTLFLLLFSLIIPPVFAKICASGVVLVYNYTANRFWTFRQVPPLEVPYQAW